MILQNPNTENCNKSRKKHQNKTGSIDKLYLNNKLKIREI